MKPDINNNRSHCFIVLITLFLSILIISCGEDIKESDEQYEEGYKYRQDKTILTKREITLFFPSYKDGLLHRESRRIYDTESPTDQAKQAINELIKGSQSNLGRIIPSKTKLREVYLDSHGVAYVDLNGEVTGYLNGGTENEILFIYSIVNTLTENFRKIKRVRLILDGREVQTLRGHVDLSIPLVNRADLIYVKQEDDDQSDENSESEEQKSLSDKDTNSNSRETAYYENENSHGEPALNECR